MDIDQKIMSLMLAAEDQQESINRQMDSIAPVLRSLESTSARLANERLQLAETISQLGAAANGVNDSFSKSLPQHKLFIARGVNEAVSEHLRNIGANAENVVGIAFTPLLEKAEAATRQVEVATKNITIKFFILMVFSVSAIVIAALFAIRLQERIGLLNEVDYLRQEKATLTAGNIDLFMKGAAMKIIDCADVSNKRRLCVEVTNKPEIITSGNRTFVVPRGY